MGGSAKQVVKKVETETKNVGRGVVHGGTQLAEGTKKMVGTTAAGLEGAGKALPGALEGFGKGLGSIAMEGVEGLRHNLDQVAGVFMPRSGGGSGDSGAQRAVGQYSSQKGKAKARKGKGGELAGQEKKRVSGKQKLFVRK